MYSSTARYYDKIYSFKDYAGEVATLRAKLAGRVPESPRLLDVACGTGKHLEFFAPHCRRVAGLDLCEELLAVARARLPDTPLHHADMTTFDLGETFDVVTCLFSAIGHVGTTEKLDAALERMAAHVAPGGVVIVEGWFTPEEFRPNTTHALLIDEPDLKIARVNTSLVRGNVAVMDLHHLIATPEGTEHVVDPIEATMFTDDEYRTAFERAGLTVEHDPEGLIGRGLWFGWKSA